VVDFISGAAGVVVVVATVAGGLLGDSSDAYPLGRDWARAAAGTKSSSATASTRENQDVEEGSIGFMMEPSSAHCQQGDALREDG
jgi:hypothetical protein